MVTNEETDLANAVRGLARDSLTDEYGVRNIVTAIYALADAMNNLAKVFEDAKV